MSDLDFREIERDHDDRLADEAGEASSAGEQGRVILPENARWCAKCRGTGFASQRPNDLTGCSACRGWGWVR